MIAAMMIDQGAVLTVMQALQPEDFYVVTNQMLCRACFSLANDDRPIDVITLADELRKRQELHKVGGEIAIAEVFDSEVTAAAVEHHAAIVLEQSRLRKLRRVEAFIGESIRDRKPTDETMERVERAIFSLGSSRVGGEYERLSETLPRVMDTLSERIGRKTAVTGITSGFVELDRLTLGFQRDELAVVAARPGVGKTAFALNVSEAACRAGHAVAIASLEMTRETLTERMLSATARIDAQRLRGGFIADDEGGKLAQASETLAGYDIRIDDHRDQTALQLRAKARRLMVQRPFDLFIVDYIQEVRSTGQYEKRSEEVGNICASLRSLAKELNVAVIALSQLLRPGKGQEKKRPMLSELKESGQIEEKADMVMFIHRPELTATKREEKKDLAGLAECIVDKQRNGPTGFFNLQFEGRFVRFNNMARDHQESAF